MRQFTFAFLVFIFGSPAFGQELGIKHYQRNTSDFSFVLPSQAFSAEGLLLTLPDSLYNFGDVNLKKATFYAFRTRKLLLHFASDTVTSVQFMLGGKKSKTAFWAYLSGQTTNFASRLDRPMTEQFYSLTLLDGKTIYFSSTKKGRKEHVILTIQPKNL